MSVQAILLPVFVLVALTFGLSLMLFGARKRAMDGGLRLSDVAYDSDKWPEESRRINAAYANVVAMPVLFYALVAFALITRKADLLFVVMSWLYVAARIVQAAAHVLIGNVVVRAVAYGLSLFVLLIMWVIFAVRILVLT